jgi:hypothetical protein
MDRSYKASNQSYACGNPLAPFQPIMARKALKTYRYQKAKNASKTAKKALFIGF